MINLFKISDSIKDIFIIPAFFVR